MTKAWILLPALLTACCCLGVTSATADSTCSSFCSGLGMLRSAPGKSCSDIYQVNRASRGVSRLYWISTPTGVHEVYCDMELECGGDKGGWMRIADLNTTRGDDCPENWLKISTVTSPAKEVCRGSTEGDYGNGSGCHSTFWTVNATSYSKVCGKMSGYQKGEVFGFGYGYQDINAFYIDGISITLGNPRKHVWTYGVGLVDAIKDSNQNAKCPCAHGEPAPLFVKDHYYCESGTRTRSTTAFYTDDLLWDGDGCLSVDNTCCDDVGQPWFFRQFPVAQDDDIEVRLCIRNSFETGSAVVEELQLYVK